MTKWKETVLTIDIFVNICLGLCIQVALKVICVLPKNYLCSNQKLLVVVFHKTGWEKSKQSLHLIVESNRQKNWRGHHALSAIAKV